MEGVRWTNEDDDEDEILESAEISKAPEEEVEEEPSWFESRESRAEDFLSIMRGEKGEDEEETEPTSLMGKLIGERPAEIDEEGEDTQSAEVQNEVSASETPDDLAENTQEDSVDSLDVQHPIDELQDVEDLPAGEEDLSQDQIEEEPAPEEEFEASPQEDEPEPEFEEAEEPTGEEPKPITYEEEVHDTPESEEQPAEQEPQEEPDIDEPQTEAEEPNEPQEDPTQDQIEEAPEPEFEASPQEDEPEPEPETEISTEDAGDGDDGGEEPPGVEPAENAEPEQQPGNRANTTPENVHVTHEHEAAGAGIVGALLGAEFFARRRGDRKLRKQMEQNKKLAEEAEEANKEKMLRLEEEQRRQTYEQERLRKAQNDLTPVEAKMEDSKDRQETTGEEIQSITGETFFDEESADTEEGRERKAGMKLETNIEESPEESAIVNKELLGEQALDSRHESSSLKDDGADPEAMVSGASSPTHISDVISSNQRMRSGEDIYVNDALDDASQSEHHPPMHESYMSSVQAGVAIGLIIVVFTAIIFFLR